LIEDGRLIKPNVLGNIPPDEQKNIQNEISPQVERILKSLETDGLEVTMNRYN
jgi:predicted transcriptional regulator